MAIPLPMRCENCGLEFKSRLIVMGPEAKATFNNVGESCPRCGGFGKIPDGTYSTIGQILEAVRTPGVAREDILAFQSVVEAFRDGRISQENASNNASEINSVFGALLHKLNENGVAIAAIASILALIIALYFGVESMEGSAQAHNDAELQLEATQTQTRVYENLQEVQQKIYEAYLKQQLPSPSPAAVSRPTELKPKRIPSQTQMAARQASARVQRECHRERRRVAVWRRARILNFSHHTKSSK